MALQLSPGHPLVWRTPHEVQLGVEQPVLRLGAVDADREFLLQVLRKGVSLPVLVTLAAGRGISAVDVERLVHEVQPALGPGSAGGAGGAGGAGCVGGSSGPSGLVGAVVGVEGRGAAVPQLLQVVQRAGARVQQRLERCDVGVLVSHFATAPRRAAPWLRADIPHLLVEFGDRSIRIGPVVVPGETACAECLELRRKDEDACWPALASQLAVRIAPTADALGVPLAAALAAGALGEHLAAKARGEPSRWQSAALRVRPGGLAAPAAFAIEPVSPHPRCGCRSLPENETERDPPHDGCP
ncbi:TOMM precursor leader peptide-binding protein [Herbiconiux liangxiaofengii]|uniref:TOMM precursor leader peptide-binding protein n=1 Tax=Herbiconiux liangxiaofengii TaxID=3342795 RepID=UPI0035B7698C